MAAVAAVGALAAMAARGGSIAQALFGNGRPAGPAQGDDKMSRGLNKVMIIGHLGREPEMRYTPSGRPVTSFSVATTRTWNSPDGERREETEWFNVVAWGNLAEICKQYLTKGQQVYIEGRLQTRRWEDQEGKKHFTTEVVANEMIMLGDRPLRSNAGGEGGYNAPEPSVEEDEFPFEKWSKQWNKNDRAPAVTTRAVKRKATTAAAGCPAACVSASFAPTRTSPSTTRTSTCCAA
jgi:single-strand DNA-binding protein